jgi:hypothetical protein
MPWAFMLWTSQVGLVCNWTRKPDCFNDYGAASLKDRTLALGNREERLALNKTYRLTDLSTYIPSIILRADHI